MEVPPTWLLLAALSCLCAQPASAAPGEPDLTALSLEELANIEVFSVSKKTERLADAPASIFVITAEDIRRSGATSIPEALRLAPNLHVGQVSSAGYSISARGMNGSNTSAPNRLLVMIDGRSVYSPLFSGVFWDVQDVVLEDIERIEVISGPGGTLWGVNAVNGVINIVTRPAADTPGTLAVAGAGERGSELVLRHGGTRGAMHYRAYAKANDRRHTETAAGLPVDDAGHKTQIGFRLGWEDADRTFDLHGDAYRGSEGQPAPGAIAIAGVPIVLGDVEFSGANLTGRWQQHLEAGGRLDVKAYYDRTERTVPPTFAEDLDIFDIDAQHSLAPFGMHSLVWGINYRQSRDRVTNSPYFAFLPGRLHQRWSSLYVQDEMALRDDLDLVLGTRLERNDYTGTEVLPSARLAWRPTPEHMVWGAASRAVRAPSRLDRDAHIPGEPPFLLDGGLQVRSEIADVYEIGYRGQSLPWLSWSLTAFHAEYDHVRSAEIAPSGTHFIFASLMEGHATGFEAWGNVQVSDRWRISGGATLLHEELRLKPGSNDVTGPEQTGNDPDHTWQLRSRWNIGNATEFDLGLRHVDALERNAVPAYTAVDAHLGWHPSDTFRILLSARNLTGSHAEFGIPAFRTEHERSLELRLTWYPR